jgi:hypothetical protein
MTGRVFSRSLAMKDRQLLKYTSLHTSAKDFSFLWELPGSHCSQSAWEVSYWEKMRTIWSNLSRRKIQRKCGSDFLAWRRPSVSQPFYDCFLWLNLQSLRSLGRKTGFGCLFHISSLHHPEQLIAWKGGFCVLRKQNGLELHKPSMRRSRIASKLQNVSRGGEHSDTLKLLIKTFDIRLFFTQRTLHWL